MDVGGAVLGRRSHSGLLSPEPRVHLPVTPRPDDLPATPRPENATESWVFFLGGTPDSWSDYLLGHTDELPPEKADFLSAADFLSEADTYFGIADPATKTDWRDDRRVAVAVFALLLCVTIPAATYSELGPDTWHEMRDDTAWAIAVLTAVTAVMHVTRRK